MKFLDYQSDVKIPSNKSFGFFWTAVFGGLTIYAVYHQWVILRLVFAFLFIFFLILTIFASNKLHALNILWLKFGIIIGKLTNPVIMGIIFFGLFTPLRLYFGLIKRDELYLHKDSRPSYWKLRKLPQVNHDNFRDMF